MFFIHKYFRLRKVSFFCLCMQILGMALHFTYLLINCYRIRTDQTHIANSKLGYIARDNFTGLMMREEWLAQTIAVPTQWAKYCSLNLPLTMP